MRVNCVVRSIDVHLALPDVLKTVKQQLAGAVLGRYYGQAVRQTQH